MSHLHIGKRILVLLKRCFQCNINVSMSYNFREKISCFIQAIYFLPGLGFLKKTFKRVLTKTCHFELRHHKSIKFQNVKVKQCEVHIPSKFALESCDNILKY